jgi:hypothetical protein
MERGDSLSPSTNIAAFAVEASEDANRIAREKIEVDRALLSLAGKQHKTHQIAAFSAVIAAIASIANFIYSVVTHVPPP